MATVYCCWTTGNDTTGDGTAGNPYKTITKAELTRAAGTVTYPGPIEDELNLGYGVEYSLHITAYNDGGESEPSNIVTFTREGFAPPTDLLPAEVVGSPAQPMGLSL